jgi:soluble lytic murein transglycosylase-like protein
VKRIAGRVRRDGFPAMLLFVAIPFGALLLAAGGHPAGIIDSDEEIRARTESWRPQATEAAREVGVPVDLLLALVATESSGRPGAVSSAGACGLTQLMPATARGMAARMPGLDPESLDLHEPVLNLRIGAAVLADELRTFSNDPALALAAYHRGSGEPARWRRELPGIPGIEVVRARATDRTRAYVERTLARRKWFLPKTPEAAAPAPAEPPK